MTANMIPGNPVIRDYLDDVERLVAASGATSCPEMKELLIKAVDVILFQKLYPTPPDFIPTPHVR